MQQKPGALPGFFSGLTKLQGSGKLRAWLKRP
jgi:hypothetical protein